MYHIEVFHHDNLIDIQSPRFTRKSDAAPVLAEVEADNEEWRKDLQARFDAQLLAQYRDMVVDDFESSDQIARERRIAPRYTYAIAKCAGKRCNH